MHIVSVNSISIISQDINIRIFKVSEAVGEQSMFLEGAFLNHSPCFVFIYISVVSEVWNNLV